MTPFVLARTSWLRFEVRVALSTSGFMLGGRRSVGVIVRYPRADSWGANILHSRGVCIPRLAMSTGALMNLVGGDGGGMFRQAV